MNFVKEILKKNVPIMLASIAFGGIDLLLDVVCSIISNILDGTLFHGFTWYVFTKQETYACYSVLDFVIMPIILAIVSWGALTILQIFMALTTHNSKKKDEKWIPEEEVRYKLSKRYGMIVYSGREYQYIENLFAAKDIKKFGRLNKSVYDRVRESYTFYYNDVIYLHDYKKEEKAISYEELAECKRAGHLKMVAKRGIVKVKLKNGKRYNMYICGSDAKNRKNEQAITKQIKEYVNLKCGLEVL